MANLQGFHGDLVVLGVQARPGPFARPCALEVPAHDLVLVFIEQNDGTLGATDEPIHGLHDPVPKSQISGGCPASG